MIKVVLIGTGNVAKHLFDAFHQADGVEIVQVAGRNNKALAYFGEFTKTVAGFDQLEEADLYLLALSDDAIVQTAEIVAGKNRMLAHTSGSTALDKLPANSRRGVFYPLQTFSKERDVDIKEIPICLEAENEEDYVILEKLANAVSKKVYSINSVQRLQLHLAAVYVNNFTNHLFHIGQEICESHNMSFDLLRPLIKETVSKIGTLDPFDAQTGPARRGDVNTMQTQLEHLKNSKHQEIYKLLSESIQSTYAKKL